jgi:hypothetical protein
MKNVLRGVGLGLLLFAASCKPDASPLPAPGTGGGVTQAAPHPPNPPLSDDDVSWLFPAPARAADMASLIAIKDVMVPDPQNPAQQVRAWSDDAFAQFLAVANGPQASVPGGSQISLPEAARQIDAWQIAGIRIDAGAPGLADPVRAQFGQLPQIRLILHPVFVSPDGSVDVQDIAAHLIFNVIQATPDAPAQPGCLPRPKPDLAAFRGIVDEIADLRSKLANGDFGAPVLTAGADLGVHPGLRNPATAQATRAAMLAFLERHISPENLGAMAVMGLPAHAAAPWIFLSLLRVPPGTPGAPAQGGFVPVNGPMLDGTQFAEALTPIGADPRVVPEPHSNNLAPITCRSGLLGPSALPVATRQGVSTSQIFADTGMPAAQLRSILARIDDPSSSHFFNTDCVSCHTETRLAMERLNLASVPGIDTAALPNGPYNVRNFGWSPPIEGPPSRATVTRRTKAETDAVVRFINTQLAQE